MSIKTMYIPLLKNTLLKKNANHHMNFQWIIIFLLVEVLPPVQGCWPDQGGGCWWLRQQFLKIRKEKSLPHGLTLLFTNDLSGAWDGVWYILPREYLLIAVSAPKTAQFMTYSKPFVIIWTICRASSPGVVPISKNHCLCSPIRSNYSSI